MLTNLYRDRAIMPAVAAQMDATAVPFMQAVLEIALGGLRGKRLRAATAHALEFTTWRSLVRDQGLARAQAIDLMAKMVAAA
jgi:hypothetical protein